MSENGNGGWMWMHCTCPPCQREWSLLDNQQKIGYLEWLATYKEGRQFLLGTKMITPEEHQQIMWALDHYPHKPLRRVEDERWAVMVKQRNADEAEKRPKSAAYIEDKRRQSLDAEWEMWEQRWKKQGLI